MKYLMPLFLAATIAKTQELTKKNIEEISEKTKMMRAIPLNQGVAFYLDAQYDSAYKYLERDIRIIKEKLGIEGNELTYAVNNEVLAGVYMRWENLDKALEHFKVARENFDKIDVDVNVAQCDYEIARILEKKGNTIEAIMTLEDAINMKEEDLFERLDKKILVFPQEFKEMSDFYWEMTKYMIDTKSTVNNKSYHYYSSKAMEYERLYDNCIDKIHEKILEEQKRQMEKELDEQDEQDKYRDEEELK